MSYDSDYENIYMVVFESGKTINVSFYNVEDVIEYCADTYEGQAIKSIYEEVYVADEEDEV